MTSPGAPTVGFLSTYPPTSCGLATFTRSLRGAISDHRGSSEGLDVVSVTDLPIDTVLPEVSLVHVNHDRASLRRAVAELNRHEVVVIQHEYGIFGGHDGMEALDIAKGLDVASIVTLHTVLSDPTPSQRSILEALVAMTDRTVVMSETAAQRLIERYDVEPTKVVVIPHGARLNLGGPSLSDGHRPTFLTWGLIGPGKGLETAIEAFAGLEDLDPLPRYIILGKTHPKVEARSGNAYRDGLVARAEELGLEQVVEFDGRYLDTESLTVEVRRADVVVLPYESTEQVTSGVLVEALGAGKPVIATGFPHARELLAQGAGIIVPHSDPDALRHAIGQLAGDQDLRARMARKARGVGSTMYWPVVAREYEALMTRLLSRRVKEPLARVG